MRSIVQSDVRNMNKRMIFELFRKQKTLTRTEISKMLNMSLPSVLKVSQQLLENNVLVTSGEIDTALGRKPLLYELNTNFANAVGIVFEGNRLSMGLVNMDGEIRMETSTRLDSIDDEAFVQSIIKGINRIKRQFGRSVYSLCGIGIAVPGVVDPQTNCIAFAPLIGIDQPFDASPIVHRIANELKLPVLLENDVNMCAVGEMSMRGLDAAADLIYINVGTGIGCGIILDGQLRRGKDNLCGEIGYFVSEADGATNRHQTGWLESVVNVNRIRDMFPDSSSAYQRNKYISQYLSPIISNITTLLDVQDVVLGGVLVERSDESLLDLIRLEVNRLALSKINLTRSIVNDPGIIGIAKVIIEAELEGLL